jgi:hypothetical protein
MLRVWLTVLLATGVAGAEPSQADQAVAAAVAAGTKLGELAEQRARLAKNYQDELATIDQLKHEKPSWRRDRELRAALTDANDTAGQLGQAADAVAAAQRGLADARVAAVAAIDAELAAGDVPGQRAHQLAQLRARVAPPPAPKKLVIPETEIDPLADPEELEHQAAAVRAAELELSRQVTGITAQVQELERQAELRGQHERAGILLQRDDDQPQRVQPHTAGGNDTPVLPTGGDRFGPNPTNFESEASVVLGDVIDHAALEGMLRASRSGDPARRAQAAKRAEAAVRARLDGLAAKRAAIELRARTLRQQR